MYAYIIDGDARHRARQLSIGVTRYLCALEQGDVRIPSSAAGLHTDLTQLAYEVKKDLDDAHSRYFDQHQLLTRLSNEGLAP